MGASSADLGLLRNIGSVLGAAGQVARSVGARPQSGPERGDRLAALREEQAEERARMHQKEADKRRDELRRKQRRDRAREKAAWGLSGVSLSSGSPLSVMEGRAAEDVRDQALLLAEGDQAADRVRQSGRAAARRYRTANAAPASGADWGGVLGRAGSLLEYGGSIFED